MLTNVYQFQSDSTSNAPMMFPGLEGVNQFRNRCCNPSQVTRNFPNVNNLKDLSDPFVLKKRSYTQQYANLYFVRLMYLRPKVIAAAKEKFTSLKFVDRVLDVHPNIECVIVGTIYMEMLLKPNILNDITQEHWVDAPPPKSKYWSDEDQIMLEDESGRIRLCGPGLNRRDVFTGVVVAVRGHENETGEFHVEDICFAGLPHHPLTMQSTKMTDDFKYLALMSGLNLNVESNKDLGLHLLGEYLTGQLGNEMERRLSKSICKLIVAGNLVSGPKSGSHMKSKRLNPEDDLPYDPTPIEILDQRLADLCANLSVDIMPGEIDPTNSAMPQQAMHLSMFPKTSYFSTVSMQTNPCWQEVEGRIILGSSGQPVDDLQNYVDGGGPLEFLEKTLYWQHMAPTTPDTLWSFPFRDFDPFILSKCPHIYFAGNQSKFDTRLITGDQGQQVRIVSVPSFERTKTIVLVNLSTLECHPVVFQT